VGFRPKVRGLRRRKNLRGNTIGPDTLQLNFKIIQHGPKAIEDSLKEQTASKK
jgi:small subunit ribosomal protein S6e